MKPDERDADLVRAVQEAKPKSLGLIKGKDLVSNERAQPRAVLFVPEGASLDDADLTVEVVGMNAATMAAMVARRC